MDIIWILLFIIVIVGLIYFLVKQANTYSEYADNAEQKARSQRSEGFNRATVEQMHQVEAKYRNEARGYWKAIIILSFVDLILVVC